MVYVEYLTTRGGKKEKTELRNVFRKRQIKSQIKCYYCCIPMGGIYDARFEIIRGEAWWYICISEIWRHH
jgi:hypothetical protein